MVQLSVPTAAGPVKKKTYHHGDLRNAIILEATARARTHGEKAIVLREIAPVIGVSATAAYRHFTNRQQLVEEVSARGFVAVGEQIALPRVAGAHDAPVLAAYVDLRNAGIALVQFAATERTWARMMMESMGSSESVAEQAWAACQSLQDIIDIGIEVGTFRAGTRIEEQRVLLAGLNGLCANAMFGLFQTAPPETDHATARTIDLCMTDMLTEECLRIRDEASLPDGIITDLPR